MFAVLLVVSHGGACPYSCKCTNYKVFCRDSIIRSLPRGRPSTTQLISMDGDILKQINSTVINVEGLSNLMTLVLVNMHVQQVQALAFGSLRTLESLTVAKNNDVHLEAGAFLGLGRLYFLDLSENGLKMLSSGVLQGLGSLRHLNLRHNRMKQLFAGLEWHDHCGATRRTLDLSGNGIFEGGLDRFGCFTEVAIDFDQWDFSIPPAVWQRLRITGVGRNTKMLSLHSLTHLRISSSNIPSLPKSFLSDSHLLRKLGIMSSKVRDLELGCFEGLRSLRQLDLSRNLLRYLNHSVFEELVSLRNLDLSRNPIKAVEENAFRGLNRLHFLDLTDNRLSLLNRNTFSLLGSLRELLLNSDYTRRIHPEAFSGLPSLKNLELPYTQPEGSTDVALETLQRLDNFEGPGYFAFEGLQIMKTLILVGSDSLIPHYIKKCLEHIVYVGVPVNLDIFYLNDLEKISLLTGIHIARLQLEDSKVSVFKNNSFCALSTLKWLSIVSHVGLVIERGAFNNLHSLEHLLLVSTKGIELDKSLFTETFNLMTLVIERHAHFQGHEFVPSSDLFRGLRHLREFKLSGMEISNLGAGNFLQLEELEVLDFSANNISNVSAGAFRGLRSVRSLVLSLNDISSIGAGVFGAVCEKPFILSCANVTRLPEFCNSSGALATLMHLDLSWNGIEYIHEEAFLGCKALRTLQLKQNRIQTLDFLYTPRLIVLNVERNNVTRISNTSFKCTSMLAHLDFRDTVVQGVQISAFQHLRNLKSIGLPKAKCDCLLRAIWQWFRIRRVQYASCHLEECKMCSGNDMDIFLPTLECNSSADHEAKTSKGMRSSNDFLFFRAYIEPIVFIFIFFSGCFGNGLLLLVIFLHSDMRNRNNACIAHLAMADILSLTLTLPLSYWDAEHITWDLNETTCKVFIMSKDLAVTLVVYSVLVLTLERFLVVRTSLRMKALCGLRDVGPAPMLATLWGYGVATCSLSYRSATVHGRCFPGYVTKTRTFQLVMNSVFPVTAIIALNMITSYMLKKSVDKAPGGQLLRNEARYKNRHVVANVITILSVVFTLSYVPNSVLRTLVSWSVWDAENVLWYAFVTYCMFFFHTIFNPFAVFVMGSKYKTHILKLFRLHSEETKNPPEPMNVKHSIRVLCELLLNLVQRVVEIDNEQDAQPITFPRDVHVQDIEVRRARQKRLKRLQQGMM